MPTIRSFSSSHPYREDCLRQRVVADVADRRSRLRGSVDELVSWLDDVIREGRCPRCGWGVLPTPPASPAGSRVPACRCIPICSDCGEDESTYPLAPAWWDCGHGDFAAEMEARLRARRAQAGLAPLSVHGWAEHGFD